MVLNSPPSIFADSGWLWSEIQVPIENHKPTWCNLKYYKIDEEWDGKLYCEINLKQYYCKRGLVVLMPNYVTKSLHKFQHPTPSHAQYAPHQWTRPNYGATKQLATPLDTSPSIPEGKNRRIQKIVWTFFYYACDVDCTMLPALNTLAEQ